jgi:hypothetical protein
MSFYGEDEELQKAIQASLMLDQESVSVPVPVPVPVPRPRITHPSKLININKSFQVCPILDSDKENIGKLMLPQYIVRNDLKAGKSLGTSENPVIFKISPYSPKAKKEYIYLGLLDFHQDDSELLYIPSNIINELAIEVGSMVKLETLGVNVLPKANYIKLQPIETTFTTLTDPRQLLEDFLNQNFTTLSMNQELTIKHEGYEYHLFIKELKSEENDLQDADITNIDLNLEFETPLEELNLQAEKERQEEQAKVEAEARAKAEAIKIQEEADNAERVLRDNSHPLTMTEQMMAIRAMRAKRSKKTPTNETSDVSQFPGVGQSINGYKVENAVTESNVESESETDSESE